MKCTVSQENYLKAIYLLQIQKESVRAVDVSNYMALSKPSVSNALKKQFRLEYDLVTYQEHALEQSSSSRAIAYVGIRDKEGRMFWGAGLDQDIIRASINALLTAINNKEITE